MGRCKALLEIEDGITFLRRIITLHEAVGTRAVIVVGDEAEVIRRSHPVSAEWIVNPDPARGPLSSIQLALARLSSTLAVIVHAVDHPLVRQSTLTRLIEQHWRVPAAILVPEHAGHKGHPVLFPARFFLELSEAPLEVGAKAVVRSYPGSVHRVPVDDSGITRNIDTPEAYERFCGRTVSSPTRESAQLRSEVDRHL